MAPSTAMRVPSVSLLRAFLRPCYAPCYQVRSATNWMPREKYAKVTGLDKLHRRQRVAERQERIDSKARAQSMQPPTMPTPTTISDSSLISKPLSSLPYGISRTSTASRSLPVYETSKAGGNLHVTVVRKCTGDLSQLQTHLLDALKLEASYIDKKGRKKENVKINPLTKQIVVRGWRGAEVKRWCEMVGF